MYAGERNELSLCYVVSQQAAVEPGLVPDRRVLVLGRLVATLHWYSLLCGAAPAAVWDGMGEAGKVASAGHRRPNPASPVLCCSVLYSRAQLYRTTALLAELCSSCRQFTVLNLLQTMGNYTAGCVHTALHTASRKTVATEATVVHGTQFSAVTA